MGIEKQLEMVTLDELVPKEHAYRQLRKVLDIEKVSKAITLPESELGAHGYGRERLVLCMLLQFMEDTSDREMKRFLEENLAGKWFCGFGLAEETPDYTTLCKFRNRMGTKEISNLFSEVRRQMLAKGYLSEVFTFVDATALTSKLTVWEERDKAIQAGYERFNNAVMNEKPSISADQQARFGSKGKNKFWFGYKKHVSVDTQSGLINKVAVTSADVTDAEGARHVLPKEGAVLADKGYVGAIQRMRGRGLHPMVILRNNMKRKNADLDRWISKLRSPYERTFSKQTRAVRYRGIAKNQAAEFLYAIAYNFRRLIVLDTQFQRG